MELGPIFRSLFYSKGRFWLVTLEIALTLAVVVNCTALIMQKRREMVRPTGMDEARIIVVNSEPFAPEFKDEDYLEASIQDDLRMLQELPGVVAATRMHAIPLSGGGSATGRKAVGSEIDTILAPFFVVGRDIVKTLGVEIVEGRDLVEDDYPTREEEEAEGEGGVTLRNVLLTRSLADKLYPDGDALGKQIQGKDGSSINTIVGIIGRMQGSWPTSTVAEDVLLFPGNPGTERRVFLVARAEPSAVNDLYTGIEEKLLALNQGRLLDVQTLQEYKDDTYADNVGLIKLIGAVVFLLFSVTALGIAGLTSFSVTQRFRQIGTRRALGATRLAILRYFLVENWIITGMGLAIGVALSFGVNWMLVSIADAPKLEWGLLGTSMVFFWLVGLAAALAPAMRSMKISPVIATRTV